MAQALILAAAVLLAGCGASSNGPALSAVQEAKGFVLTRSRAGAVEWKLESPRAVFDEERAKAKLDTPRIALYKKGKPETAARSERGEIDLGSQDTLLAGSVFVENATDRVSLKTDELAYIAKDKEFRTERPVAVERPEGVMRGRGLTANQDLTEIHVHHQETRLR